MTTAPTAPERAGARQWTGLAVLALPTLLASIDISVLNLAAPHISADLQASGPQLLWVIDIYAFMIAGFLVTMGTLGDRIGRRRLLLIGGTAFGAASVLAAYSTSPEMLIGARALLGLAGATLMPSTLALISNMFGDPRERGMAIALWATVFSVGIALGPVVGGALLQTFWWGSVFLMAVPVMLVMLVLAPFLLPEFKDPDAGRVDLVSVLLSLAALLPVVYGLKELARDGASLPALAAIAAGLAVGAVFVYRQRSLASPLLDLGLFRNWSFSVLLTAMLMTMFVAGGTYLFITQYLQLVVGQTPLAAGLWLLPGAVLLTVTSMTAPMVAAWVRPAYVVAAGLGVSGVGHAVLALVDGSPDLTVSVVGFTLILAGGGPLIALGTDLILSSAPEERAGSASALSETSTELGTALGIAVLGSIGTFVYRSSLTVADGLPTAASEAARDSLAATVVAAEEMPQGTAASLVESAQAAFTSAVTVVGGINAALSALLALLIVLSLRHIPAMGAQETETGAEEAPTDTVRG
ncbi:MFS transporter [Nocardiopsis quinghaiensis]|uniref:MFS transporter n=1 Tax=Nocardiopsis quinghaiensis TaxID=464995 RepID=UPI0012393AED|nr:MFS transporter [Nocardiopsis quinghaiensis]